MKIKQFRVVILRSTKYICRFALTPGGQIEIIETRSTLLKAFPQFCRVFVLATAGVACSSRLSWSQRSSSTSRRANFSGPWQIPLLRNVADGVLLLKRSIPPNVNLQVERVSVLNFAFAERRSIHLFLQWGNNTWIFCAYKFALFLYWLGWTVASVESYESEITYLFYLTSWGSSAMMLYFGVSFGVCVHGVVNRRLKDDDARAGSNISIEIDTREGSTNDTARGMANAIIWQSIVIVLLIEASAFTRFGHIFEFSNFCVSLCL